jgi:hypothetical protein
VERIEQAYRDPDRELRKRNKAGDGPDDLPDETVEHGGYLRDEDYRQEDGGAG